jgi:hypothetical protein
MRSRELGYNGYFSDIGLSMDVKLFYDEITGMISEPLRTTSTSPATPTARGSPAARPSSTGA